MVVKAVATFAENVVLMMLVRAFFSATISPFSLCFAVVVVAASISLVGEVCINAAAAPFHVLCLEQSVLNSLQQVWCQTWNQQHWP